MSEYEREDPRNILRLVRDVEAILESENQGWVQYIAQLQEGGKEEGVPQSEENILLPEEADLAEDAGSVEQ